MRKLAARLGIGVAEERGGGEARRPRVVRMWMDLEGVSDSRKWLGGEGMGIHCFEWI